jgi:YD repeat-containing protein
MRTKITLVLLAIADSWAAARAPSSRVSKAVGQGIHEVDLARRTELVRFPIFRWNVPGGSIAVFELIYRDGRWRDNYEARLVSLNPPTIQWADGSVEKLASASRQVGAVRVQRNDGSGIYSFRDYRGALLLSQIQDRNQNTMVIDRNPDGSLRSVADPAGRVLSAQGGAYAMRTGAWTSGNWTLAATRQGYRISSPTGEAHDFTVLNGRITGVVAGSKHSRVIEIGSCADPNVPVCVAYSTNQAVVHRAIGHPEVFQFEGTRLVRHSWWGGFREFRYADPRVELPTTEMISMGLSSYQYDAMSNRIMSVDPYGNIRQSTFAGGLRTLDNLMNIIVAPRYYDANGNLIKISLLDMQNGTLERQYVYDSKGNMTGWINEHGIQTVYRYDSFGRLIEVEYPGGKVYRRSYDLAVRLWTDPDPYQPVKPDEKGDDCGGLPLRFPQCEVVPMPPCDRESGCPEDLPEFDGDSSYELRDRTIHMELNRPTPPTVTLDLYFGNELDQYFMDRFRVATADHNGSTGWWGGMLKAVERGLLLSETTFRGPNGTLRATTTTDSTGQPSTWSIPGLRKTYQWSAGALVGERVELGSDPAIDVQRVVDAAGRISRIAVGQATTRIERDRDGRPLRIVRPSGPVVFRWSATGELTAIEDAQERFDLRYASGRVAAILRNGVEIMRLRWHSDGRFAGAVASGSVADFHLHLDGVFEARVYSDGKQSTRANLWHPSWGLLGDVETATKATRAPVFDEMGWRVGDVDGTGRFTRCEVRDSHGTVLVPGATPAEPYAIINHHGDREIAVAGTRLVVRPGVGLYMPETGDWLTGRDGRLPSDSWAVPMQVPVTIPRIRPVWVGGRDRSPSLPIPIRTVR